MGLVTKLVTVPSTFEAIPIQKGLSILLRRKASEVEDASTKMTNLLKKFEKKTQPTLQTEEPQFSLVFGRENLIVYAGEGTKRVLGYGESKKIPL